MKCIFCNRHKELNKNEMCRDGHYKKKANVTLNVHLIYIIPQY
jgi:hypothetical protein